MVQHSYCDRCNTEIPLDRHYSFSTMHEYKVSFIGRTLCKQCEKELMEWFKR